MSITIRDVAAAAGVSVATVSRVANAASNAYPVRAETRQRVLDAISALGYRPNDNARGLLRKKSGLIGVVVPDISNAYYPEVSRGVEDVANAQGYTIMVCSTDRLPGRAAAYIDALLLRRVDGLVIVGGGDEIRLPPATFATYDTKVVLIGKSSSSFCTVRIDNVGAARDAARHLIQLGHERIAFITASMSSNTAPERARGYRAALHAAGLRYDRSLVADGDFTEAGAYAAVTRLLRLPLRPTAVLAANDRMALGSMAAAADLGFHVPNEVAVVGFDDVPMSAYLRPALTTVSVSAHELGERAMGLLLDGIGGGKVLRHLRVKTQLVVRDSCGASLGAPRAP